MDPSDPDFPRYLTLSTSNILQQFECVEDACEAVPVGFRPAVRSQEAQVADLQTAFPGLEPATLQNLAFYATEDVVRQALGEAAGRGPGRSMLPPTSSNPPSIVG